MIEQTCATCFYWRCVEAGGKTAKCKRLPPRDSDGNFPRIGANGWCGEWREKVQMPIRIIPEVRKAANTSDLVPMSPLRNAPTAPPDMAPDDFMNTVASGPFCNENASAHFNPDTQCIDVKLYANGAIYPIPLNKCTSAAEVLDWIFQVSKKGNCSCQMLGELVMAFHDAARQMFGTCAQSAWTPGGRSKDPFKLRK